jgi:hypothetical protein
VATSPDVLSIPYLRKVAEEAALAASQAKRNLNDAIAADATFHVGDVAVSSRRYGGYPVKWALCEVLITRTKIMFDRVHYIGTWKNKDGSWGKQEHDLYRELHPVGWTPEQQGDSEPITSDMP